MSEQENGREPLKHLFGESLVDDLAKRLAAVEPRFRAASFRRKACEGLDGMEMMARVGHLADALHAALPAPPSRALAALTASLPPLPPVVDDGQNEASATATGLEGGYRFWPYGEYILRYGPADVDASFVAMIELTQRFSSEFAVRSFLANDLRGTLARLGKLTKHPSEHVRRWVSEGTRSRLPWAKKVPALTLAIEPRLALLHKLRHDPARYVQRSVANHLQDILKDDPARGREVLVAWAGEGHPTLAWVCKHAARGLLKAGDETALSLFGYKPDGLAVRVQKLSVSPKALVIGDTVRCRATLVAAGKDAGKVRVDFALTSPTKTGKTARKVFRWAEKTLTPGESWAVEKPYAFQHRSIRVVYPGRHTFEILVNGAAMGAESVEVAGPASSLAEAAR
jgi:3-methyladenine DNA glycosylase AlkC